MRDVAIFFGCITALIVPWWLNLPGLYFLVAVGFVGLVGWLGLRSLLGYED